ncbi:hypothetical protein [Streptomyces camelliae]|uniref:Uncharacterized protein n=1 Tax=Streptomyces camelliae TaxID=3004093 RepID=A0ABY7PE69_9ACTN|nr:hypothetical protein [Streptomyces sp. HUAS 2-6]WBO68915.1 hypothetical protein O1G22_42125 [Streptomyces sp. HUAS 2-6]
MNGSVWAGLAPHGQSYYDFTAPAGAYVISAGFWLNGHYYGDVESPVTYIR